MKLLGLFLLLATAAAQQHSPARTESQPPTPAGIIAPQKDPNAQKAADLLRQCIAALGGQSYLTLQDMSQEGRTYSFYHGESKGGGAPFWRFWRWPDKERVEFTKQRDIVVVHNGEQGYEITFKGTAAEEPQPLADFLRRRRYSLENVLRKWLPAPGTALFYDGPALAERRHAEAVSIINADNEQVTLYLDSTTHLPIQKTFSWRDPKDRERVEELEIFDNYRNVDGVMTPHSYTRKRNGEMLNQRFITAVRHNQGLPDSLFEATVTYDPYKRSGPRE
jgi:hypothetical protein